MPDVSPIKMGNPNPTFQGISNHQGLFCSNFGTI